MCTYVYTYLRIEIYIYLYVYINKYTYTRVYVCTYTHTHTHTYTYIYTLIYYSQKHVALGLEYKYCLTMASPLKKPTCMKRDDATSQLPRTLALVCCVGLF